MQPRQDVERGRREGKRTTQKRKGIGVMDGWGKEAGKEGRIE